MNSTYHMKASQLQVLKHIKSSSVANGSAWSQRAEQFLSSLGALFGELLDYSSALTARGSEWL